MEAHNKFESFLRDPSSLLDEMTTPQIINWLNQGTEVELIEVLRKLINNEAYSYASMCQNVLDEKFG